MCLRFGDAQPFVKVLEYDDEQQEEASEEDEEHHPKERKKDCRIQ